MWVCCTDLDMKDECNYIFTGGSSKMNERRRKNIACVRNKLPLITSKSITKA